jgi:S-(hydroxymethyl)glutathione dehydrogenase/alcohol dehydrogenase
MRTRAAVCWETPGRWSVEEVELLDPADGEVLIQLRAAGLCHSDENIIDGSSPMPYLPICGGHEGAGVVAAVGPGVTSVSVGDHVVTTFLPSCGRCRWCASGMQNLCDKGASFGMGARKDGTFRMRTSDGTAVAQALSTFAEWTVLPEHGLVPVPPDVPFEVACLLGCGVPTGWGSAVVAGGVQPGDVVVVVGAGGVGINAVQGAHAAGAAEVVAIDPIPFKRESALKLGATRAYASLAEAVPTVKELTNGQGADAVVLCPSGLYPELVAEGFAAIRKGGTVVVTGIAPHGVRGIPVELAELTLYQKRIQGALFGMGSPAREVGRFVDLYRSGRVRLDELVTRTYPLADINAAVDDLKAGRNIRGVLVYG